MVRRRTHSSEFRVEIAQRMVAGENVSALARQYRLPRTMIYRWRAAYLHGGPAALTRSPGRPRRQPQVARDDGKSDQQLKQRIAELERKVGQQAVEIDFFKGVFKRVDELPKANWCGDVASTRRSDE